MYAYTPEVYPTDIRGLGIGLSSSVARFGVILTPYAAQVLFYTSDYATISLYAGTFTSSFCSAITTHRDKRKIIERITYTTLHHKIFLLCINL